VTLSRSLKVGTTTESTGKAVACFAVSSPGLIASFIGKRITAASDRAKAKFRVSRWIAGEKGRTNPKNANDHEQQARVHPALPCYFVVVPAPELFRSIDVAVRGHIGKVRTFRKGHPIRVRTARGYWFGTSLITGPRGAGAAGAVGAG